MKTEVPVTAVVLTPTASSVPSFVAWLKPPFAPAVGLIRFLRVEKEPELFGQKHPGPASGKLTGPFTQVLAVKHENQSDHQLNEKSQDLLYTSE